MQLRFTMRLMHRRSAVMRRSQRGLSIIEFLVGLTVGLFVVGGATKLFVDYLGANRRALIETRVNQDLRAAADLIVRDLRRASYWRNAAAGIYTGVAAPTLTNPYGAITMDGGTGALTYSYSKDDVDNLNTATEQFGVMANGELRLLMGGQWRQLTDPNTVTVNQADLSITVTPERVVDLSGSCPCLGKLTCSKNSFKDPDPDTGVTGVNFPNRPRVIVRQFALEITGHATNDSSVVRQIRETVRPRNDLATGACPA